MFAEHSIQMIFSFLKNIAIHKHKEPLKELHILPILLLGPVQTIIFLYLLCAILKAKFTFTWFEEPRLHFFKRARRGGVLVGTGVLTFLGGLGGHLADLIHGGLVLYYLIKISRNDDDSTFNSKPRTKGIILHLIITGLQGETFSIMK